MTKYNIACLGEILWDLLPGKELPGGAPMNVAYHLQKLSQQVAMVSRTGTDDYGGRLLQLMEKMNLDTGYVQADDTYATGKVNAWMDEHNDMQYDILFPVAWDHISWNPALEVLLKGDELQYIVFGSLMARHEASRETLRRALQSPAQKVLDINLRAPWYSRDTLEWLMSNCQVLKLNVAELELISAWYGLYANQEERILALVNRFHITTVVVTLGSKGCMGYITGAFHYQEGQPVTVADTIGSGDAFLAGFLVCQLQQRSPAYSLAFANALGALVASRSGGCPQYDTTEIYTLMKIPQIG
ncbi:carbohydrate kinase family protein [Chitinophaga sp. 22321]|uniref:Carbohydrate kinase n=1 Tax=Chitinophaga hostae TaxID=2831022 RepID=A0ABS5IXU5_9BACT|nr:carbohydrate kinase [Chitinophaga hostae]MBS0027785.1 carbohydrate kinase [Chitinophaga hostae]